MTRTFNILTKIELTEEQNNTLDHFISMINKYDVNQEINEVYLSMSDITDGILNNNFCPIVFMNCKYPSDELYEGIKNSCIIMPEYISREEEIPTRAIVLWAREE